MSRKYRIFDKNNLLQICIKFTFLHWHYMYFFVHFWKNYHVPCGFIFMHIYYICTYFISGLPKGDGFMSVLQRVQKLELLAYVIFVFRKGCAKTIVICPILVQRLKCYQPARPCISSGGSVNKRACMSLSQFYLQSDLKKRGSSPSVWIGLHKGCCFCKTKLP